jgi:OOP family OmpA-OmpF porin
MNKTLIIAAVITSSLIVGCASQPLSIFDPFHPEDLNGSISSGKYVQKADNFFVINDSSSSMADKYIGMGYPAQSAPTKLSVEKEILNRINLTIPELKLTSSIRSFGFGPCLSWGFTKLNQPPTNYSTDSFRSGIDTLTCASGGSPMNSGIEGTAHDLTTTTGNIAVLILSDGNELDSDPVMAVQSLKQQYGDKLCVYTVWVGNNDDIYGKSVLNQLADLSGCGFGTTAERISSPSGMAKFVQRVFLKSPPPPVPDCSMLDDDVDGINNCNDKCPDTLAGSHVNHFGCWIVDVKFDNNKSIIKHKYFPELDNAVSVIKQHPGLNIEVQGHTSNTGSAAYNLKLSERRAQAVKDYLSAKAMHAAVKLTARGYGLTQPVDTNETEAGRANNRRVQLQVIK